MGRKLTIPVPAAGTRRPENAEPAARRRRPAIAGASPGSATAWSARGRADYRARSVAREYDDPEASKGA